MPKLEKAYLKSKNRNPKVFSKQSLKTQVESQIFAFIFLATAGPTKFYSANLYFIIWIPKKLCKLLE